jgi:hypothetical protein
MSIIYLPTPRIIKTEYFNCVYELQSNNSYKRVIFDLYNGIWDVELADEQTEIKMETFKMPDYIIKMELERGKNAESRINKTHHSFRSKIKKLVSNIMLQLSPRRLVAH